MDYGYKNRGNVYNSRGVKIKKKEIKKRGYELSKIHDLNKSLVKEVQKLKH